MSLGQFRSLEGLTYSYDEQQVENANFWYNEAIDEIDSELYDSYNETVDDEIAILETQEAKRQFVITAFVSFSVAFLFCAGSAIFILCYRKKSIIMLSQPSFLIVMFSGAAMIAASGFYLVAAEVNGDTGSEEYLTAMCSLWIWTFVIGHNIMYMALFGKLWRIKKVTRVRRSQNITYHQTIWPLRVMTLVNIVLLTAWTVLDAPNYHKFVDKNDAIVLGTCDFAQLSFFIPLQLIIFVSAFLGWWMTYKTKDLPQELNEEGRVFHIYFYHTVTFLVFGTLYWVGRFMLQLDMMNIAILLATFFTSVTSVAPIIVPKIYYIWYEKKHGHLPEGVQTLGRGSTHVNIRRTTPARRNEGRGRNTAPVQPQRDAEREKATQHEQLCTEFGAPST
jgi:hypothetical protein